jgi:hypothetical protein
MNRRIVALTVFLVAVIGISVHAATDHSAGAECIICALCPFC